MSLNLGFRRKPRRPAMAGAVVVMLALVVIALVGVWSVDRANRMSDARAWTVDGPPCPSVTPAALAASDEAAVQATTFSGVGFDRAHGAVRCSDIGYDDGRSDESFPVCQFDHPGGLEITTRRGRFAFRPPPLDAATVQVRHDVPTCVLGSSMEIH
jgi:hypothetical protein